MLNKLWSFLKAEENQKLLGWIGGGLVVLVTGLWAVFTFYVDHSKPPLPPATARAQGQAAGAAFAQISRADSDQAASYARAIQRGVQEAEREDDEAREIAQNAGALRELGFPCRDAEDDHDF
jgi:hypothetical protein